MATRPNLETDSAAQARARRPPGTPDHAETEITQIRQNKPGQHGNIKERPHHQAEQLKLRLKGGKTNNQLEIKMSETKITDALAVLQEYPDDHGYSTIERNHYDQEIIVRRETLPTGKITTFYTTDSDDNHNVTWYTGSHEGEEKLPQIAIYTRSRDMKGDETEKLIAHAHTLEAALIKAADHLLSPFENDASFTEIEGITEIPF